jgi:soluble lytic murein transglycosylase-like protein
MSPAKVSFLGVAVMALVQLAIASKALAESYDGLIAKHSAANAVPEWLVRRVIRIESRGNPRVVSKGNYGLMQIRLGTARAIGYRGTAQGLLDPDTNMTYAVKYLAGAYRMAGCNDNRAISYYQHGYYGARKFKCGTNQTRLAQGGRAEPARRQAQ